jgi:hypothetical protein
MVDGYAFQKCYMYALLWVNAFISSWHVFVAWLCLICGWIAYFDHMGPKSHLPSWMFNPMLDLVEGHKFLFVAKTFHVPNMNLKMKCKLHGKCAPMSYVLNLICFGCSTIAWCLPMRSLICRSRHMAQWLWHDMMCLWVFMMVLWLEWLS